MGAGHLDRANKAEPFTGVCFRPPTWDGGWSPNSPQPPSQKAPWTWCLFIPAIWLLAHVLTSRRLRPLMPRAGIIGEQTAVCRGHTGKRESE